MKKILILLFLASLLFAGNMVVDNSSSNIAPHSPDLTNCVGYYPLSSYWADGASISDISGNGNTGTSANAPNFTADQNGVPNQAMSFDGSSDDSQASDTDFPEGAEPFTISTWIKTSTNNSYIYSYGTRTSKKYNGVRTYNDCIYHAFYNADTYGTIPIIDNIWHNAVITFDGTTVSIYVDGVFDTSANYANVDVTKTGTFYIGQRNDDLGYFYGSISDVAIYSDAKSADWIAAQYAAGRYTAPIKSGN